jgi:hypothetical protein
LSQTSKWLLPFFSFFCALDIIRQCFTWAFCNIPKSTPPPKNQPFPWCFKQEYKAKSYLSIDFSKVWHRTPSLIIGDVINLAKANCMMSVLQHL